jgi:hypothetical protein
MGMANGIRIERRADGLVDVVVEGLAPTAAMELAGSLLTRRTESALPIQAKKTPARGAVATKERKKAARIPCPICGRLIGPQGMVSHQRTQHPARKARKAS